MTRKASTPLALLLVSSLLFVACSPAEPEISAPAPDTTQTETADPAVSELVESDQPVALDSAASVSLETTYQSPAGPEDVGFLLTVDENGIITDTQTEVLATAPISVTRQESFAEELSEVLVGRNLAELTNIDRVGGSSLTTDAFNAALPELKAQL